MYMPKGNCPSSPYTIKSGVLFFFFACNRILQILSTMSLFPTPHTSLPYNKIGLTILSNNQIDWAENVAELVKSLFQIFVLCKFKIKNRIKKVKQKYYG
jgi:hypothetical protein